MKNFFLRNFQRFNFIFSYLIKKNFSEKLFLKKILNKNSIVVDIGSNIGSNVKNIKSINENIFIHSIEPNISLINYQKKIFPNDKKIKYHNFAISYVSGLQNFYIRKTHSHSSLISNHQNIEIDNTVEILEVQTFTLEEFFHKENLTSIDYLKLDTEGLDYEILNSCKSLLLTNKIKHMKVEVNADSLINIFSLIKDCNLKIEGFNNIFYFKNKFQLFDLYLSSQSY